jgi:hypothetical protein
LAREPRLINHLAGFVSRLGGNSYCMANKLTRIVTTGLAAMAASTLLLAAPASAAPVPAPTSASASASAPAAAPTRERNPDVSRSMTGVRSSAYVGTYYDARYESTRKCIVRKESGGNYRIASRSGTYKGAYQFNSSLARSTARRMGRSDLVNKPFNQWSRFDQDKAFWVVWNHGKGRSNWPTARGC